MGENQNAYGGKRCNIGHEILVTNVVDVKYDRTVRWYIVMERRKFCVGFCKK